MQSSPLSRSLHWVLKIGDLEASMKFYESVLGLRVLRHEEFAAGCEATCNGPYGGAWSKTMVGYAPESRGFALELTFNYGISSYSPGNDLQYIAIQNPAALVRAEALGCKIEDDLIFGPDNYKYKCVPAIAGREELFVAIGIRVTNLDKAKAYWIGILGLHEISKDSTPFGLDSPHPNCLVGFSADQTMIQLIEAQDGTAVIDHAQSGGRIAFACTSVSPIYDKVSSAAETVLTPPLTLKTPGKADVVVAILADPDAYEICFVEAEGFYNLSTPTFETIDFKYRAARIARKK